MMGQTSIPTSPAPLVSASEPARTHATDFGRPIEIGFRLLGWSAVTVLIALGLVVVAFALLGNLTFDGFFAALANLADRYVVADAARRASFKTTLVGASLILLVGVAVFRRGSLAAAFCRDGEG